MAIQSVMLVCTGNICRSPMAEGLMRQHLPELRVYSSGLGAMVGMPATDDSVALIQALGVDISAHRKSSISSGNTRKAAAAFFASASSWRKMYQIPTAATLANMNKAWL